MAINVTADNLPDIQPKHMGAKVIAVVGKVQPIKQFYAGMGTHYHTSAYHYKHLAFSMKTPVSKLLSEGTVRERKVNNPSMAHPIYIVGTGKQSLKWLEKVAHRLKGLDAQGFAVNVPNNSAYQKLVRLSGLHPTPVDGDIFAKRFGIHHYPVLISKHWIEQ